MDRQYTVRIPFVPGWLYYFFSSFSQNWEIICFLFLYAGEHYTCKPYVVMQAKLKQYIENSGLQFSNRALLGHKFVATVNKVKSVHTIEFG